MARHSSSQKFLLIEQVGPEALRHLLTAAALAATADGVASPEERRGVLTLLRRWGVLARHGRAAVLAGYRAAIDGLPRGADVAPFRALAGTTLAARAYAMAERVAASDGRVCAGERTVLAGLQDALAIAPVPAGS